MSIVFSTDRLLLYSGLHILRESSGLFAQIYQHSSQLAAQSYSNTFVEVEVTPCVKPTILMLKVGHPRIASAWAPVANYCSKESDFHI